MLKFVTGFVTFSETNFQDFFGPPKVFSRTHNARLVFLSYKWTFSSGCSPMSFEKTILLEFTDYQDFPTIFLSWKMLD